jgi:serine/threonine-protein kinase
MAAHHDAPLPGPPAFAPGDRVGRYRLRHRLGEGVAGWVHAADAPDGAAVVVKLIKPWIAREPGQLRRFEREVRGGRAVEHPNVVPVLDAGEHRGLPYLVQPRASDGSLRSRMTGHGGAVGLDRTVSLAAQIAAGLHALHGAGFVHRDLKPENILLFGDRAAVTDFGVIKDLRASIVTRRGELLGTPHYMAPEQIRGGAVTPGTDVYALGCVAYECLCGAPPFAAWPGLDVLWAHLDEAPPELAPRLPDCPPEVGEAVALALAKDPEQRPRTAPAFARLLGAAAAASTGTPT